MVFSEGTTTPVSTRVDATEAEQWAAFAAQQGVTVADLLRDATRQRISTVADGQRVAGDIRQSGHTRAELAAGLTRAAHETAAATVEHAARELVYTREPCPYQFSAEHSLIRDTWAALQNTDPGAAERLERFSRWQRDHAARADAAGPVQFAVTTANASQVITPGYLPLWLTPEQDRPLRNAADVVPLPASQSATPFNLPGRIAHSGAAVVATEGVNPAEGTLTPAGAVTVSPKGISGTFRLTREILDAANPAIDQVAVTAMREAYAAQCEALVYAELNGASGQGGTITAGFVPSGAQVYTATAAGNDLHTRLREALARYPFRRKLRKVRNVLCGQAATVELSEALDETSGDDTAMWRVQGAAVNPAESVADGAAGDGDVFGLSAGDLWCWESPLLTFRYDQRVGPEHIDLAVHGYFATRLVRPVGLFSIRLT